MQASSYNSNNNNNNRNLSSSSWSFRPSVLQEPNYHQLKVDDIVEHYIRDNSRAEREGVAIPPHPNHRHEQQQQQRQQPCVLRTVQWNIQAFRSPRGDRTGISDVPRCIFETHADVLILNEYHWTDYNSIHKSFERQLRQQGYKHHYCALNDTPTLIATRHPVLEYVEIRLSYERSALCLKVSIQQTPVWVVGTHLDHVDGSQRRFEMQRLLENLEILLENDTGDAVTAPVIVAGDFNQQRRQDYTKKEWKLIKRSMDRRNACRDDGVSALLEGQRFACVFDQLQQQLHHQRHATSESTRRFNWETASRPPSTHWSGTTIDYSYSRNIPVHGVYISPAGYSDHRMTVCDWTVPASNENIQVRRVSATAKASTITSAHMELWKENDDHHMEAASTTSTATHAHVVSMTAAERWIADDTSSSSSGSVHERVE